MDRGQQQILRTNLSSADELRQNLYSTSQQNMCSPYNTNIKLRQKLYTDEVRQNLDSPFQC